jgi:hypothetical protein
VGRVGQVAGSGLDLGKLLLDQRNEDVEGPEAGTEDDVLMGGQVAHQMTPGGQPKSVRPVSRAQHTVPRNRFLRGITHPQPWAKREPHCFVAWT